MDEITAQLSSKRVFAGVNRRRISQRLNSRVDDWLKAELITELIDRTADLASNFI